MPGDPCTTTMPTNRRRIGRQMIQGQIPAGALWWVENGCVTVGGNRESWQTYLLHYDHRPAAGSTFWSRADLRAIGYGALIDALIERGACPPDGWREAGG